MTKFTISQFKMGYDNFALLAFVTSEDNDKYYEIVEESCKYILSNHDDFKKLFGCVHHLNNMSFNNEWYKLFDDFMLKLYINTPVSDYYLYVCENDGESLIRYKYSNGIREDCEEIKINTNSIDVSCYYNINSLVIQNNFTIYTNDEYLFDNC